MIEEVAMIKKVLVIDDETDIQTLIQIGLETAGYEVIISENAQNGLDLARLQTPDLIILDVVMPGIDGADIFKVLKNHDDTKHIPIIILTARAKMEDSFLALGATAFVEKPFQADFLENKVREIIGESSSSVDGASADNKIKADLDDDLQAQEKYNFHDNSGAGDGELDRKFAGKVLVAGTIDHIVAFMKNDLEKANCLVEIVEDGDKVAETAFDFNPDLILLETQMGTVSAYDLIQSLRKREDFRTQILLYTYHMDPETARNSIVHLLYDDNQREEKAADLRQPIYYFGIYNKKTFNKKIKRFIN